MSVFNKITKAVSKVVKPVSNLIGDTLNSLTGVNSQMDKSYEQQLGAMEKQNEINKELWNMSNEYNSPASQLARMAEAGIDVNPTAYALGSSNLSNTASTISSGSGFSGSGSPAGNPISMLMGVAQGVQGLKNARADYQLKQTTNQRTELENQIMSHNLKYGQDHNLPVGSVPGMDATMAQFVNSGAEVIKDIYGVWQKHRKKYIEDHPDYNGW